MLDGVVTRLETNKCASSLQVHPYVSRTFCWCTPMVALTVCWCTHMVADICCAAANTNEFLVPMPPYAVSHTVANVLRVNCPHNNIDAACSSGYLGIHRSLEYLSSGQCNTAVVAGVQLLLKPRSFESGAGKISSKAGIMRPFDVSVQRINKT